MRFATKLTILTLGIIAVIVVVISYFLYTANIDIIKTQIIDRLEDDAFHTMDKIDSLLRRRLVDIEVIAADPIISSRYSTPQVLTERLKDYRDKYQFYASLSFFDLNRVRIADTGGLDLGKKHEMVKYWEDVLHGNVSAASDVRRAEELNAPIIYFASLVRDENGEPFGAVVARMPIDRLYEITSVVSGPYKEKDLEVDLVNRDGLLLYSSYNGKGVLEDNLNKWESVKRSQSGEKMGTSIHRNPGEEKKLYVFIREQGYMNFKGNGWTLVLHLPTRIAFAPLAVLRNRILLGLFPVIIFSVLIAILFSRTVSGPIVRLRDASVEIGKGNWDYEIAIITRDEIAELADAFKKMASSMKNKQTELLNAKDQLADFSKGLETKVAERTKELMNTQEAMLNIMEDMTEARHKLEEALKIKSEFTSTVSHELRTPLAAIKEGIAIVLDGAAGDLNAEQKEFLSIAKRNVDRLARLINDILDFQKLESGKMPFNIAEDDINELITEVGRTMAVLAAEKGLELAVDPGEGLPNVKFDRDKITQVLDNIVNNAVKFTEKGGITMATRIKDGFIQVSVQDTGAGIKEEDMARLFTRFEQLEKGIERRPGGTGLGLAISKEIVEVHKGRIWVESVFGKGSTFYFTLPI